MFLCNPVYRKLQKIGRKLIKNLINYNTKMEKKIDFSKFDDTEIDYLYNDKLTEVTYKSFNKDFFPPEFSKFQSFFNGGDSGIQSNDSGKEDCANVEKLISDIDSMKFSAENEVKEDPWKNNDAAQHQFNEGYSTFLSNDFTPSFFYTPMSSVNSVYNDEMTGNSLIDNNQNYSDQAAFQQQPQTIWNYETIQQSDFKPSVMSTPMSARRYDCNVSYKNVEFKENAQPTAYQMHFRNVNNAFYNNNSQPLKPNYDNKFDKKAKPNKKSLLGFCVFCKNNGADESAYSNHTVKDSKGRVLCPKLRVYKCPLCGVDGDNAHTVKYCPMKPIITMADLAKMEAVKRGYRIA